MLRVGLTGGLGSGKSTVAALFAARGAQVLVADEIGRALMQPGKPVYKAIVAHFSALPDAPALVLPDGQIDRAALARYAFSTGRILDLSSIVHPAVVASQERKMQRIFARDKKAIVIVESALIFEADRVGTVPGLPQRFDEIVLVTAPEPLRITRYVERICRERGLERERDAEPIAALEADARLRIAAQIPDVEKIPLSNHVVDNSGPLEQTEAAVEHIVQAWRQRDLMTNPARGHTIKA
jgi:dephospho-CoA kinase